MDENIKNFLKKIDCENFVNDWKESTPMRDFFKNKTIFLTGATGGVGQLITQKLLRIDVKEICVLVRSKRGKTGLQRMKELFDDIVYGKVRKENPNFIDKVKVIEGNLLNKKLGMSDDDINYVIENVNIVLHVAADVRFDQPFRTAIFNNIRSVYDLIEICNKIKNLNSFIYMSTAYSNNELYIEEKMYNMPIEPEILIKFAENLDPNDEIVKILISRIIIPWGNIYTYTKNLAEYVVQRNAINIPTSIIRPSIIIATESDPIPGWTDNLYNLNGVMIGFGSGLLRILFANKKYVGDVIPVDYVANATLAVAWATHLDYEKNNEIKLNENPIKIYNCVSSCDNPQTWGEIDRMLPIYRKYPSSRMKWYTATNYSDNLFLFKFYTILYHCIPAMFIDIYLSYTGEKVRLMQVFRLIQQNILVMAIFMKNWRFSNKNMRNLFNRMTEDDHKIFPCDVKRYSWDDYLINYCLGLRLHFVKDPLENIEMARQRAEKYKYLYYFTIILFYGFIAFLCYQIIKFFGYAKYINFFIGL